MIQPRTKEQRLDFMINYLLSENEEYQNIEIPASLSDKRRLLRSLMNVRPPVPISKDFLKAQDEYLKERLLEKGITKVEDLVPVQPGLYIWQGDITTLRCDAIVNAANSQMLGCFVPCHGCIDNAIHTFAGVQLRQACSQIMAQQGRDEETGSAKITPAFNLPCRYVLHTVGPIVHGRLTERDEQLLASCYRSCLTLADQNGVQSIAFCCISTGEFHFPNERAAQIAVETVKAYKEQTGSKMEVIFNVFKEIDAGIYRKLLGGR